MRVRLCRLAPSPTIIRLKAATASRAAAGFSIGFVVLAVVVGCGGSEGTSGGATIPAAAAPQASTAPILSGGGLTLQPIIDSPTFAGATLGLAAPAAGEVLSPGKNMFHFDVAGYELGVQTTDAAGKGLANSAQGQHIHFILDNGPYSALYGPHLDAELSAGHHVVLAFLSRSYHESVKSPGAAVVTNVAVSGSDEGVVADLDAPHLFYSRPKGSYKGDDTKSLMLDFYLVNTDLSPTGNKVRARINGNEFLIEHWVPYAIEGLPLGEVSVDLELIDAQGDPIPGPFNHSTRTVTLTPGD